MFNKIMLISKNILLFTMIMIIALVILSFSMLYIDYNETTINILVQALKSLVILSCGARAARLINRSGLLMSAISGLLLTFIILLISIIFIASTINVPHVLIQLLLGTLIGIGGGFIGVNTFYTIPECIYKTIKGEKVKLYTDKKSLEDIQSIIMPGIQGNVPSARINKVLRQYVDDRMKISGDCIKILNDTINPKVFFEHWDTLNVINNQLVLIEDYYKFQGMKPSERLAELETSKELSANNMMDRLWESTLEKAIELTTQKSKADQLDNYFRKLYQYQNKMSKKSIEYLENKKQEYLENKEKLTEIIEIC